MTQNPFEPMRRSVYANPGSEPIPSEPNWIRRTIVGGTIAAVAVAGAVKGPGLLHSAEEAMNGAPLSRCLDEPLAADTTPIYPTMAAIPTEKPLTLPSPPDLEDYPTMASFNKAWAKYKKAFDAYINYKSPEEIANEKAKKAYDAQMSPKDIQLRLDEYDTVEGQPHWLYDVESKVQASTVLVSDGKGHGTGFVVEQQDNGELYVVTAAHVVGSSGLKQLTVTKPNGTKADVTGGCFIYDTADQGVARFASLETDRLAEADVAILRIDNPDGLQPLKLRDKKVKREEWVGLVNYQGSFPRVGSPSSYNGLVVQNLPGEKSYTILSGFGTSKYGGDKVIGGASGGPVVDKNGDVVGLSFKGLKDVYYEGAESLGMLNVKVSTEDADTLKLNTAGVIKVDVLRKALDAIASNPITKPQN